MVTYQLDETVYSTGPASSTSHSSPQKPQLEKTVVKSVNSKHSSLRESINLSKKDNATDNTIVFVNTTSSGNETSSRGGGGGGQLVRVTVEDEQEAKQLPEDSWKLTEKYDVLEEQNNRIADIFGDGQPEEIDFSHHSKTTRSEGSSLQEIKAINDVNVKTTTERSVKGTYSVNLTDAYSKSDGLINASSAMATLYDDQPKNGELDSNAMDRRGTVLKRRRGELRGSESRQNDGTYESQGVVSTCGGMNLLFSKDGQTTSVSGKGATNEKFYDDDDEGIKKLRKILREAQKTIEKFQMDFHIDDSFRKNKPPLRLWERLKNEKDIEEDGDTDKPQNEPSNGTSVHNDSYKIMNTSIGIIENGPQDQVLKHNETSVVSEHHHKIRHQHHHKLHRQTDESLLRPLNKTVPEQERLSSDSAPEVPNTTTSLPAKLLDGPSTLGSTELTEAPPSQNNFTAMPPVQAEYGIVNENWDNINEDADIEKGASITSLKKNENMQVRENATSTED